MTHSNKARALYRHLRAAAKLMIGIKSYEAYLAQAQACPHTPVMSEDEFFRYCQEARYAGKGSSKCPC